MRTNIVIEENLIRRAMRLAGVKTKREAVEVALRQFVKRADYHKLLALAGAGGVYPGYDPKAPYGGTNRTHRS